MERKSRSTERKLAGIREHKKTQSNLQNQLKKESTVEGNKKK